jgi:hypothetical protein
MLRNFLDCCARELRVMADFQQETCALAMSPNQDNRRLRGCSAPRDEQL